MIPYIEWTTIQIGPLTLYVWGLFVALGFLLAAFAAGRMAKRRGLKAKVIYDLTFWMMLAGFVGGRLGYVLFYAPGEFIESPDQIFKVWDGGSSLYGGIILAVIVGIWYLKKSKLNLLDYADTAVFGIPFGLWIGRLGCFFIHDHPGIETNFILGVNYPDGIIRHDHGLYLSLNGLVLGILFLILAKKQRPAGTYIAVFSIWYGAIRFFLDFFRALDVKYAGLTPAQYFSILLLGFGIWLAIKLRNKK